jgi:hypothetical protein
LIAAVALPADLCARHVGAQGNCAEHPIETFASLPTGSGVA